MTENAKDRLTRMKDIAVAAAKILDAYKRSGNLAPRFDDLKRAMGDATDFAFSAAPIEPKQTIVDGGFAAAYTNHDGTIGFLTTDDGPRGSGYPCFSTKPDSKHIYADISKAGRDVNTIIGMTSYHGHEAIDFDTARVVKYGIVAIEIIDPDQELYEQNLKNARGKLSEDEMKALIRSAQPTG